ncbi:putative nucleotidyltransferase-like protein [Novosphingobium kunmingense]|uniref:Putative nucleotidyltransferase-like protein n=1 Tax=Novosphingobium kunmingense TaxID=1211806 RepID=A0A2N0H7K0_9SPHN|nr:nucleotidyltransferase family protein [Novosphingobium kunmingense]PKB14909.1 putative nucleotidyltransferase-like protein [Novosphingobium kunmingense]
MARPGIAVRTLLDLAGTATTADLSAPIAADWQAIGTLAALHRLGPWLHHRHKTEDAIPEELRRDWAVAYRQAALTALVQHADAADAMALLDAQGFEPVALKGAFLARNAYPEAALRPMRDIDILVPADRILPAFEALRAAGHTLVGQSKIALEEAARLDKHMPPLRMPRGTMLELHARLMERNGRLEYATPEGDEHALRGRAIVKDGLRYPAPADLLAHLVVHAVYGHRFDCGPLLLTDVRFLAASQSIDWDLFWQRAEAESWADGAALVLALVRHYHGAAGLPRHAAEPAAPDDAMLDLARSLLLQDFTTKINARFLATLATGGFGKVHDLAAGRVRVADDEGTRIDRAQDGGRLAWTIGKLRSLAASLADPAQRRQARDLARFRRWLQG